MSTIQNQSALAKIHYTSVQIFFLGLLLSLAVCPFILMILVLLG